MKTKKCCKCKDELPHPAFSKNKSRADGLNSYCKKCMTAYRKKYNRLPMVKKKSAETSLAYHHKHRDRLVADMVGYHQDNREQILERQGEYYKDNIAYMLQRASIGRGERAKRAVLWGNQELIDGFYEEARRLTELTGIKFHVDHIIPLQGKLVSGLHVEGNLQILTQYENQSKLNKFDVEEFNEAA